MVESSALERVGCYPARMTLVHDALRAAQRTAPRSGAAARRVLYLD